MKSGNPKEKVYQVYERLTGKPWKTAKEEGLTDGSYQQNIRLVNQLREMEKQSGTTPETISSSLRSSTPSVTPVSTTTPALSSTSSATPIPSQVPLQNTASSLNIPGTAGSTTSTTLPKKSDLSTVQKEVIEEKQRQFPSNLGLTPQLTPSFVNKAEVQKLSTRQLEEIKLRNQQEEIYFGGMLPQVQVKGKKGFHPDIKLFNYQEPENVTRLKQYQKEKNLKVTGAIDEPTFLTFSTQDEATKKLKEEATTKLSKGKTLRQEYMQKVREKAKEIKVGDDFGMYPEIQRRLESTVDADKINHCIGGICKFLDEKVQPGIFQGGFTKQGFMKGSYFSNPSFEEAHKQEGWQSHKDFKLTTPDVGDILRVNYAKERGRNHAMLVVDKKENPNDKGNPVYTILDNSGKKGARVRQFTLSQLDNKFNAPISKLSFYRKTKFDDIDLAETSRQVSELQTKIDVPVEFKDKTYTHTGNVMIIPQKSLNKPMKRYIGGINNVDSKQFKDIPEDHLKTIAMIAANLPFGESEEGEGGAYRAESASRLGAKILRKAKSGTDMAKTLSVGLSQINPASLSNRIKEKYFKGMKDREIERKINLDSELQGKISFEVMVDRYRSYRNSDGSKYGYDPSKFWYALINSWQNPNKALKVNREGVPNVETLEKFDWDYSNNILTNFENFRVKTIK